MIKDLKEENGENIWICGGAGIANQLIKCDLIDVYHITVIPIILGDGIRLFSDENKLINLNLMSTDVTNGMVELVYKRK